MSEIMLSKSYDATKLEFPAEVTIKVDGVAADFYKTPNGWLCQSRQGKPIVSTGHIVAWMNKHFPDSEVNTHIIGELCVMGVPTFKEASGIIRKQEPDERIMLYAYDCYTVGRENVPYNQRKEHLIKAMDSKRTEARMKASTLNWYIVQCVPKIGTVRSLEELQQHFKSLPKLMEQSSMFEGYVIRNLEGKHSRYGVGKRSWGMMKYKPLGSYDLRVVGFEEATANKESTFLGETFQKDEGLRAVGRLNLEYNGQIIGAGSGSLTHEERRELWELHQSAPTALQDHVLIAEIHFMIDPSYSALREARFFRWRPDKDTPSYEH